MSDESNSAPPRLIDELRESQRDVLKVAGPLILVALLGFLIAFPFIEPPPPSSLVMAAGEPSGNYSTIARKYAEIFKEFGIELTVKTTGGSVENYSLLLNDPTVRVAIVQGGTLPEDSIKSRFESLATLYVEPLWIVQRKGQNSELLSELRGKRLAIGKNGSGTQVLAKALLAENGVRHGVDGTEFVDENAEQALQSLNAQRIDVAFFVLAADSPFVKQVLSNDSNELLSLQRNRAYAQRHAYLKDIVLPRGVIDLEQDLPARDIRMIAPVANLVAVPELHDAFIPLFMEAATVTHNSGDLVTHPGEQPSLDGSEFQVNPVARHYLKHGPSFFLRYLGFWPASLIDRTKILLVPLLLLLYPIVKMAPAVYRWRVRSRIYRWYALLRGSDEMIAHGQAEELRDFSGRLSAVEGELEKVKVPLAYMDDFYQLWMHIDLCKRRVDERLAEVESNN